MVLTTFKTIEFDYGYHKVQYLNIYMPHKADKSQSFQGRSAAYAWSICTFFIEFKLIVFKVAKVHT